MFALPDSDGQRLERDGYDEIYRLDLVDSAAFLVLHAVIEGRTFGGIRIQRYQGEAAALDDACELAEAMSRKAMLAGLPGGGAKAVVIEPPTARRAQVVRALGRVVESLEGRYYSGADLGFTDQDHAALSSETRHIACSGLGADSARTVLLAMRAACELDSIEIGSVAIQGLGSIGLPLARALRDQGVDVVASDPTVEDRVFEQLGIERVAVESILDQRCDVFAPCAVGHVLDLEAIERLRCRLVCGGANNPFASIDDADRLQARGIAYVPDVIANSGALIRGASTVIGQQDQIEPRFAAIPDLVVEVLERATREKCSPHHIASRIADQRIAESRDREHRRSAQPQ